MATIAANSHRQSGTRRAGKRIDVVMVRKSGSVQDEKGQADSVGNMMREQGIEVPDKQWFYCIVPRSQVEGNKAFKRLMELVRSNQVRTIYVETQDRFGTDDVAEFFAMVKTLRDHRTRLFDLRDRIDLTQRDDRTLMTAFMNAMKSSKERRDLSFRAMRKKVPLFLETGSWPSGVQPFGFGKRCYKADGKSLMWEWQPTSRTRGNVFFADEKGKLLPGPTDVAVPRKDKEKRYITKLVPSSNKRFVKTVRLIFELFANNGLSYRAISKWLNDAGHKFYAGEFRYNLVAEILKNPAYVGDTHYGKTQAAAYYTFDENGKIESVEDVDEDDASDKKRAERRSIERQLVKRDTHKGLIDRKLWNRAQTKLQQGQDRVSFAPRNPAYFLKQILVCGHCGKNMSGRMEGSGRNKFPVYFCSSYIAGRSNAQTGKCGAHRITHADAERLLMDKLKELQIEFDQVRSDAARNSMQEQLASLDAADVDSCRKWQATVHDGVEALCSHFQHTLKVRNRQVIERLRSIAAEFYWDTAYHGGDPAPKSFTGLPLTVAKFKSAVAAVENAAVTAANEKLTELRREHADLTRSFARATDMMQESLLAEAARVEAEIKQWEPRTVRISERLSQFYESEAVVQAERDELLAAWPTLEATEKGESLRRIFKTVSLHWDQEFVPRSGKPSRPIKTERPGRNRFTLRTDKIGWHFNTINLSGSS